MKNLLAYIIILLLNSFSVLVTLLMATGIVKIVDMLFATHFKNEAYIIALSIILCIVGQLKMFELSIKREAGEER